MSQEVCESYIQVLLPAYQFSLLVQKSKSSIGDVIPALLVTISKWEKMKLGGNLSLLVNYIIQEFKRKFDFELNSEIYNAAAILETSKLHHWHQRSFSMPHLKIGFSALTNLAISMRHSRINDHIEPEEAVNDQTFDAFECFYKHSSPVKNNFSEHQYLLNIEREISVFTSIISQNKTKTHRTSDFWLFHSKQMPILSMLAAKITSIPSSSAVIERFFSICGVVCKPRTGNMSEQTIISRSLFKCNINLLDNMYDNNK